MKRNAYPVEDTNGYPHDGVILPPAWVGFADKAREALRTNTPALGLLQLNHTNPNRRMEDCSFFGVLP